VATPWSAIVAAPLDRSESVATIAARKQRTERRDGLRRSQLFRRLARRSGRTAASIRPAVFAHHSLPMHVSYAAYGSNLDAADLAVWCDETGRSMPLASRGRRAWLPDRRLAFTVFGARRRGGVLDVVPQIGSIAPCAVFDVDAESLATLDRKESVGVLYRRLPSVALGCALEAAPVVTYEVLPTRRDAFVAPHAHYLEVVQRGLIVHGHDPAPLAAAACDEANAGALNRIFVYGTLMEGECRHHVLLEHGLRAIENARVSGQLLDLGRYPGLIAAPPTEIGTDTGADTSTEDGGGVDPLVDGDGRSVGEAAATGRSVGVVGQVATVEDIAGLLKRLDRIEGFGGWGDQNPLYWRRLVEYSVTDPVTDPVTESTATFLTNNNVIRETFTDGRHDQPIAWTYLYARPPEQPIVIRGGDWRSR